MVFFDPYRKNDTKDLLIDAGFDYSDSHGSLKNRFSGAPTMASKTRLSRKMLFHCRASMSPLESSSLSFCSLNM